MRTIDHFEKWWQKMLKEDDNPSGLDKVRDLAEMAFTQGWNCGQAVPIYVGGRYKLRSGAQVNGDDWRLESADVEEDRFRLVPIVQTMPIFWESDQKTFNDAFLFFP